MAKLKPSTIVVKGNEIRLIPKNEESYISLTDIAKGFGDSKTMIQNWMRTRSTVEFLGVWENMNNDDFNRIEFEEIKNASGSNAFSLSPKKWIEMVGAIGITSKAGRYGGGTFAHSEIASEFASWLSPSFKLFVFQELNRLKGEEAKRNNLDWNVHRIISKANFQIHSEAVKKHLVPPRIKNTRAEGIVYANEADILNVALFGMPAKQWKIQNPELKGNMRDNATTEQLLVLSNLQSLNAKLMEWGSDAEQRLDILNKTAIDQMGILTMGSTLKQLPKDIKQIRGREVKDN
ncbi:MAG: KilA-N domain-containing protein [Saprospiraceae bacterium]|nr:KilA-N domain-containing protein [Saprospiraceae bacterium]MDC3253726.1 KilA-N domain-containing protein [bacterium]MDG1434311.1 KilA-N domain-containing protein [Saprospiraceae bacterium]MDG2419200.1 KilA-N domain-containing protein [Saprospiraceae bacterium]